MGLYNGLPLRARLLRVIRPGWFKEYVPDQGNLLLRCECGELLWMKSPTHVLERHMGHGFKKPAIGGTWQEMVQVNRGLVE